MMKWLSLITILPAAAAFQQATTITRRTTTSLNYFPDKFARAEECATHYGSCNIGELENLATELDQFTHSSDNMQGHDDYLDTEKVAKMLRAQSELKHMMTDYVDDHHEETFDMSDV